MKEKVEAALDDFAVTLEFSVKEVNALLNMLNTPIQVPAITLVSFINAIQMQAAPQVEKAKASLEAVFNADGVPKDLEEKN
jgi:hypothetical protein